LIIYIILLMFKQFSNSKILITGGAGFIGSHLTDKLLSFKAKVTVVDNLITGKKDNLNKAGKNKDFKFIQADASQPVNNYTQEKFDYIFHFASPASPEGYIDNPIATYKINAFGTHYLTEYAQKTKARLIFASTSEVYGYPLQHPQTEEYWGNVNPVGIRACYDESKRLGETIITTFIRQFPEMDARIIRIFNTYGPRMKLNDRRVIPNFVTQAINNQPITVHGQGKQTRSFCYISDLIEYIIRTAVKSEAKNQIINIGNSQEYAMFDLAEKIKKMTNSSSKIVFTDRPENDPNKRKPDISKAIKLLAYQPQINLQPGLEKTIEYFKDINI